MSDSNPNNQHDMTAYVLGLLEPAKHAEFEARLARDPQFAARIDSLRRSLSPLDSWQAPEPPPSLVNDILDRVQTTTPLEYVAASSAIPPETVAGPPRRAIISMREALALAACIALLLSAFVPGAANMRSRQLQAMCGNNLAGFHRGLSQYAAEYDGALPSTPGLTGNNWLHQPNRRHFTPAIRLRFVAPTQVFCPSTPVEDFDEEAVRRDPATWLSRMNIRFYSTQNMNGPVPRFAAALSVPLAADTNPVFENGRFDPDATRPVNSRAHDGWGQNVLFRNGAVEFLRTPVYGHQADNIWQAEDVERYFGTETQRSATDAFLIP